MDRILFGDNQFFGINHMSEEKSREQSLRFKDAKAMIAVLDIAYDLGLRTFMCTTHDRIAEICDHIRANSQRYQGFEIYPCMPYAHKYANAVTEHGIIGAIKNVMPDNLLSAVAKGGVATVKKDFLKLMELLIDAEMKMFRGIDTPVIFLQNVVTDLLLGLGIKDVFVAFTEYIQKAFNAEAGFITMNMIKLLDVFEECGIRNPIICSSINKIGFRMSGGNQAYERAIGERQFRPIAMQVLAAGAIPPAEALEYVCKLDGVKAILFGASTKDHIQETKELIEKFSLEHGQLH